MSSTTTPLDSKSINIKGLSSACTRFQQDLDALPEEAFLKNFGGKTRTIADFVHEVNLVNDHIGMVIRNEEPFVWPEGWIKAPADFRTKEDVVNAFKKSSQSILETMESFTPEEMEAPIQTDNGESTRAAQCRFMTFHVNYHSGQLNYIQGLLGDDGWHWV